MTTPDLEQLIGGDLPEAERERLRRVHELLIAAGPPPEAPAQLASPQVRTLPRRRFTALLIAAALAVAVFGAGWLAHGEDEFDVRAAVSMHATKNAPGAWGKIELGYPDDQGNWEMLVTVGGLNRLPEDGYYELSLTLDGKPTAVCGSFKVKDREPTTVRLGASYDLSEFDGWVVRPYIHDREKFNQTILLRTGQA